MEKLIDPYNRKCMRKAILKHEETFKEQVYELHRLYHIQKILMNNSLGNSMPSGYKRENKDFQNEVSFSQQLNYELQINNIDLEEPAEAAEELEAIDESEIELTLGITRHNKSIRQKSEAQLTSDSGLSFSSSYSTSGSSNVNIASSRSNQQRRSSKEILAFLGGCEEQLRQDA